MRILLRNRLTRFYLVSGPNGGLWTDSRDVALVFASTFDALKCVQEHGLNDMEIVLTFGEPELDLSIGAETIRQKRKNPRPPEHPLL